MLEITTTVTLGDIKGTCSDFSMTLPCFASTLTPPLFAKTLSGLCLLHSLAKGIISLELIAKLSHWLALIFYNIKTATVSDFYWADIRAVESIILFSFCSYLDIVIKWVVCLQLLCLTRSMFQVSSLKNKLNCVFCPTEEKINYLLNSLSFSSFFDVFPLCWKWFVCERGILVPIYLCQE